MARLKRELSTAWIVLLGVGVILGAGIYVLVGATAGIAGNAVWLAFLIASLVALFTGLSYAELSSMFPKAGAEYAYAKNAFGRRTGFSTGWVILAAGIASAATVAIGFGNYLEALAGVPSWLGALFILLVSTLIIARGVKQSAVFAAALSVVELFGLLVVIAVGLPQLPAANIDLLAIPSIPAVMAAASLIFFAYLGFEDIVRLAEETNKPEKTVPRALLLAIGITTVVYVLTAIAAVALLPPALLASSGAPLAEAVATQLGSGAFGAIAVIALLSTANTVLLLLLASSRLLFGMARGKELPSSLARIEAKTGSPQRAVWITFLAGLVLVPLGAVHTVALLTDFFLFVGFISINLALLRLRRDKPAMPRPFRSPLNFGWVSVPALLGILTSVALLVMIDVPIIALGVVFVVAGDVIYRRARQNAPEEKKRRRFASR